MDTTSLVARIVGPVLLLRAVSILLDPKHFSEMVGGLETEVTTVSFSLFPIALVMTCIAVALVHRDTSTVAALLIHAIAWGGIIKGSALILWPHVVVRKAAVIARAGFLQVVAVMTTLVGAYFTWFGYLGYR